MTSNQNQKTESSKAKENVNTHVEKLAMNLKDHQGFQPDYLLNKTLKIDLAHLRADRLSSPFVVVVQLLSYVQLLTTPWTAAHQASLSLPSPGLCSNLCPLSRLCHSAISSPFNNHLINHLIISNYIFDV